MKTLVDFSINYHQTFYNEQNDTHSKPNHVDRVILVALSDPPKLPKTLSATLSRQTTEKTRRTYVRPLGPVTETVRHCRREELLYEDPREICKGSR